MFAIALASSPASAHIELDFPAPRTLDQKEGPCGLAGSTRGAVTTFAPGSTITVHWHETVDHPGHYRIAFDPDGDDSFYVPTAYDDVRSADDDPTILVDGISDANGEGVYEATVTLPDVECDNCTLQLIQMMTDKAPYDVTGYFETGNDLYYQCADVALVTGVTNPTYDGCACVRAPRAVSWAGVVLLGFGLGLLRRGRAPACRDPGARLS